MTSRKVVLAAALALINVPVVWAVGEAVAFFAVNQSNGSFVSSGQKRDYVLYVPRSYDSTKPTPLVISIHGAAMWGAAQRETSQWDRVADREGFIVVYPSGAKGAGPRIWHVGREPGLMRDVTFIAELIDTIGASYNIDRARIYANGLSNGGGMSFVLSCTLSDRIAAVGMVAAAQTLPFAWCPDRRPVPMIAFHGTADRQVPYTGGVTIAARERFPDVSAWVASWARRNQCAFVPVDSAVAADAIRRKYAGCANDAGVELYTIKGGGHSWPGGKPLPEWWVGRTSRSVDATAVMWEFFRSHRLR